MKTKIANLTLGLLLGCVCGTHAQNFSPEELTSRIIHRRAVEAVIWGMPAVNAELMFQAAVQAKGGFNQVVYWSRPVSWKNQTLTPNPDTIYLMPFYNTKDVGPVGLEIPPAAEDASITGSIDDGWQTALEDVGPAGVDKGKGGKYLILPPDYKQKAPAGYIVLPSATYTGFVLLRSNFKSGSDADIAKAVAYGNPDKDAIYLNVTPARNDGNTIYQLTVKDVPVDGFWSISLYNKEGYFEKNDRNAYSLNSVTSKKDADGSFPIQFGGCDGKTPNCLPIVKGWNYMVRLYRPRPEILNGTWKFPEARPVK